MLNYPYLAYFKPFRNVYIFYTECQVPGARYRGKEGLGHRAYTVLSVEW